MVKQLGMQLKIVLASGLCLVITAAAIVTFSSFVMNTVANKFQDEAIQSAKQLATVSASQKASQIQSRLEAAMNAARTLAETFSGIKDERTKLKLDRDALNNILKIILERNSDFMATYTAWETNQLDELDELYKDSEGYDTTGRFVPYWYRNGEGKIAMAPLVGYDKQDDGNYYYQPKKTSVECIIDPRMDQNEKGLVTSLVAPIMVGSTFYGIAGIDLQLTFFQELVDDVKNLYGGSAQILLVSHDGVIAAVTGKPGLQGKPVDAVLKNNRNAIQEIQGAKETIQMTDTQLQALMPLHVGNASTPWAVYINIPKHIITAQAEAQQRSALQNMWKMIGISFVGIVLAVIFLWYMARHIAKPIHRAIEGLNRGAEEVSTAANQVSASSQGLSENVSSQAATTEETSSSLEMIAAMTQKNADSADTADKLMDNTIQVVGKMEGAMKKLIDSMAQSTQSSEETAKIIKTIDDIAFQTNLLALNAAVEAARAGEAGAGFAVVADEVRSLAMRAADAAKNTADLIEDTVTKIKDGSSFVTQANEAFQEVADSASKVGELVSEISAASKEQSSGIDQLNSGISDINNRIQQTAANAEESASISEEMSAQAGQMQAIVGDMARVVGGNNGTATTAIELIHEDPDKDKDMHPRDIESNY